MTRDFDSELAPYLERAAAVSGSSFEFEPETLEPAPPWDYEVLARTLVLGTGSILDLGTGGGEVLSGGEKVRESCYACTVLNEPPADARISTAEIFGPAVCVYAYDDIADAIARANSLPYSFQAAVCTRDIDTALYAYRHLDASAVMVNDHTAFRVDWMPFAGLRQSGHGVGGIHHSLHDIQIEKMMVMRSKVLP